MPVLLGVLPGRTTLGGQITLPRGRLIGHDAGVYYHAPGTAAGR
jgi:hypothetical protein